LQDILHLLIKNLQSFFSFRVFEARITKLTEMFFLGLLSTPLPYLLLAAFYFFGFAMGLFNNKTGDEITGSVEVVAIAGVANEDISEKCVYFFQTGNSDSDKDYSQVKSIVERVINQFEPDPGIFVFSSYRTVLYNFKYSNSLFCRPPPVVC
jgi:hypothetical protein